MECKTAQKLIPEFIDHKMTAKQQKEFLAHISNCEACKEELSIQFLVTEGMNVLDGSDSYDLQKALDERLMKARREIRLGGRLRILATVGLALLTCAVIAAVVYLIFNVF